jgi:hypothetical protein
VTRFVPAAVLVMLGFGLAGLLVGFVAMGRVKNPSRRRKILLAMNACVVAAAVVGVGCVLVGVIMWCSP